MRADFYRFVVGTPRAYPFAGASVGFAVGRFFELGSRNVCSSDIQKTKELHEGDLAVFSYGPFLAEGGEDGGCAGAVGAGLPGLPGEGSEREAVDGGRAGDDAARGGG